VNNILEGKNPDRCTQDDAEVMQFTNTEKSWQSFMNINLNELLQLQRLHYSNKSCQSLLALTKLL